MLVLINVASSLHCFIFRLGKKIIQHSNCYKKSSMKLRNQVHKYLADITRSKVSHKLHIYICTNIFISCLQNRKNILVQSPFVYVVILDACTDVKGLPIDKLLPRTEQYMTYSGSLTQPGCRETVTWIILNKPTYISRQQVGSYILLFCAFILYYRYSKEVTLKRHLRY